MVKCKYLLIATSYTDYRCEVLLVPTHLFGSSVTGYCSAAVDCKTLIKLIREGKTSELKFMQLGLVLRNMNQHQDLSKQNMGYGNQHSYSYHNQVCQQQHLNA